MEKYILSQLNDRDFDRCFDELFGTLKETARGVFDKWIERGIITEDEREKLMSEYDEKYLDLFESLG